MPQVKQSKTGSMSLGNQIGTGFLVFMGMAVGLGVIGVAMTGLSKAGSLVSSLPVIAIGVFILCVVYTFIRCFLTGMWFPAGFAGFVSVGAGLGYAMNMANVEAGGVPDFVLNLLRITPWVIFAAWVFAAIMATFLTTSAARE